MSKDDDGETLAEKIERLGRLNDADKSAAAANPKAAPNAGTTLRWADPAIEPKAVVHAPPPAPVLRMAEPEK